MAVAKAVHVFCIICSNCNYLFNVMNVNKLNYLLIIKYTHVPVVGAACCFVAMREKFTNLLPARRWSAEGRGEGGGETECPLCG